MCQSQLEPVTAAPISLERLHLCCKGSCEFVESSHRTALLRNPHHRAIFLLGKKQKTDPPQILKILRIRNAHLYRLVREYTAGNGSIR
jgi:hypothetical protein